MFRTEASATPASSAQVSLHKRHRVRGVENIGLCRYLGVEVDIYLHIYTATVCDITILIITTLHDKCIQTRCPHINHRTRQRELSCQSLANISNYLIFYALM